MRGEPGGVAQSYRFTIPLADIRRGAKQVYSIDEIRFTRSVGPDEYIELIKLKTCPLKRVFPKREQIVEAD